jgi:ABC-2 type transport system ATP-binding protein
MVVLESMTRRYGGVTAVESLSLRVERGEMFGLIGPDGAGKTTTLRVVLGLLTAHGGRVLTCGLDPVRRRREVSRRTGYLSQRFSLYGDLSVDENVAFFAEVHGVRGWTRRRDELLEMLRLAPFRARLADRLSGGMKQKLALACTLIHTPDLLVLDEPTTGVDPVSRRDFWRILVRLQRDGLTILLTTPYLDEAERCRRVALLDSGRLLALDSPDTLRRQTRGATLEVLAMPHRRAAEIVAAMGEVTDVETFGERLHVGLAGVAPSEGTAAAGRIAAALAAAGVVVESIRPTLPTLEDVFIARIREAESRRGALNEVSP